VKSDSFALFVKKNGHIKIASAAPDMSYMSFACVLFYSTTRKKVQVVQQEGGARLGGRRKRLAAQWDFMTTHFMTTHFMTAHFMTAPFMTTHFMSTH
jgi:hypothetical protein